MPERVQGGRLETPAVCMISDGAWDRTNNFAGVG